jgi:beta-glucosidase-like glycosyl hydrolase
MKSRGNAMGMEHRGKGVDVQLGPVAGPLGRAPEGGRNWEGFSPDPVLTGIAIAHTIQGIQDAGVVACAKHFILNEQEHFREPGATEFGYSSNLDDKTMHELYLWLVETTEMRQLILTRMQALRRCSSCGCRRHHVLL